MSVKASGGVGLESPTYAGRKPLEGLGFPGRRSLGEGGSPARDAADAI